MILATTKLARPVRYASETSLKVEGVLNRECRGAIRVNLCEGS